MTELGGIAIAALAIVVLGALWRWKTRRTKRSSGAGGAFGWALLFLSSGRIPPPPPQSQIEQDAREKKNRESSRDHMS